jgi:hypothetical protein
VIFNRNNTVYVYIPYINTAWKAYSFTFAQPLFF